MWFIISYANIHEGMIRLCLVSSFHQKLAFSLTLSLLLLLFALSSIWL